MQLLNQQGADLLQGLGIGIDLAATTDVAIVYSGTSVHPKVDESDTLRLRVTNNVVVSAKLVVDLYYAMGG